MARSSGAGQAWQNGLVPNGVDKNLVRLAYASALYRHRYREWPSQARLPAVILWDIAQILTYEDFEILCSRLQLRSSQSGKFTVGGSHGYVIYDGMAQWDAGELMQTARMWLGVSARHGLE